MVLSGTSKSFALNLVCEYDWDMRLCVKVQPRHIRKGKTACPLKCPAALAIEDAFAKIGFTEIEVKVGSDNIDVVYESVDGEARMWVSQESPRSLIRFINQFDNSNGTARKKPEPFNFYINL